MSGGSDYESRIADEASLASYLEAELGPVDDYEIERHGGGHSNETLFITWGDEDLVLRRPPPGETADAAHEVLREYRVTSALQDTDVRVPRTVCECEDESVIGGEFYVMARVEGDVIREEEPDRFAAPEHRRRIGEELIDTLAAIHTVDYEAVGLEEFGHPEGYMERQVDRWRKQFEWAFEVTWDERPIPEVEAVGEWLAENVPEPPTHALVHGDYKLDNVMLAPGTPPELACVLDWEMSTLGDPLADLGWLLHYWRDPDDPDRESDAGPDFTAREGYHTRRELVDRYESQTGIDFENERFYRAFTSFKMGGIGEMFFRRHLEGNADNPTYPLMEEMVPERVERAQEHIEGTAPL
jgi:aminoglycoside phosphotransferase (APT) family kinase protein